MSPELVFLPGTDTQMGISVSPGVHATPAVVRCNEGSLGGPWMGASQGKAGVGWG